MKSKSKNGRVLLVSALLIAGGGMFFGASQSVSADVVDPSPDTPSSDNGIDPIFMEGNVVCEDIRDDLIMLKTLDGNSTVLDDGYAHIVVTTDGTEISWTSNVGIDAVVVKGGNDANAYVYDPPEESFGDGGMFSPDNPNGQPAGLSHVSFCYDLELLVNKTAVTSYNRDWNWEVEKDVNTAVLDLFDGESGFVTWEVTATKLGPYDTGHNVAGTITITNPAPVAATVTSVTDSISGGVGNVPVTGCDTPFVLAPGGVRVCNYTKALADNTPLTNTATVVSTGVLGGSDSEPFAFGEPTNETDATATASDTNGESFGPLSATETFHYDQTFECSTTDGDGTDAGLHVNTVEITGGDSDSAETTVNCYGLNVTKTANTTQDRTFDWTPVKTSDVPGDLVLALGQVYPVTFTVELVLTSDVDNWAAAGVIRVANPAPIPVDIVSVTDAISGVGDVVVDCGGVVFPLTLAADDGDPDGGLDQLTCLYASALPDGQARVNTATVTTEFGVAYQGTADISFVDPEVTEFGTCVSISDTQYPLLAGLFDTNDDGLICVGEEGEFDYTLNLTAEVCGPTTYSNVVELSNGKTSTVTIESDVPCDTGCTLTIGYWKTHSSYGPAPVDPDWFSIGDADGDGNSEGPNETFFLSGKTWYQVFWTPPAGNPYYTAAHQYMGARLNIANDASTTPAVTAAITAATLFFQTYGPNTSWTKAQKALLTGWNGTLASYNQGNTGPGHCDER